MRPTVELLERDQPMADLMAAAIAEHSSLILLPGEAGIGKTSIVHSFLNQLPEEVDAYVGACDDLLAPPTLGPLREAFRGHGGDLEEALAGQSIDRVFDELTAMFTGPSLHVLVIEDVHWADDVTVDVLRHLARRLDRIRALILLTYRPDAVESRGALRALLGESGRHITRIKLGPLSAAGVETLAAGSGHDAQEVHALTKGNPFYVTEILSGPLGVVPATVVDAVLGRFAQLSDDGIRALELLSVVPSHLQLSIAEGLLGPEIEALDDAERVGLVVLFPDGIGFRHEIARRAIEQQLPGMRRRALNASLVDALLAESDPDLPRVIHHAVAARDVPTILKYGPAVARAASAAGSHHEAAATFGAVMPHADQLPLGERASLLDDYAWELHIAHRFFDAVQVGGEAIRLSKQVGLAELAETLLRVSRSHYLAGDTQKAMAGIERAGELAEGAGSREALASISAYRSMIITLARQGHAPAELRQARKLALEVGRTDLAALCLNYLGVTYAYDGNPDGLECIRDSLKSALDSGDHESAARAYTSLAAVLFREDRLAELASCLADGLTFVANHGIWSHAYDLEVHQAQLDLRLGMMDAAEDRLRQLMDAPDDPGMFAVYSMPVLGRILARRGLLTDAETLLTSAWRRAWAQESLIGILYSGLGGAEWAWLSQRKEAAETIYLRAMERPVPDGLRHIMGEIFFYLSKAGLQVEPFEGCPEVYTAAITGDWERAAELTENTYEHALFEATSSDVDRAMAAIWKLDDLGARPAADLARADLRRLGVTRLPRRSPVHTRANPVGLTDRQLDVLRLLASARTNADIATELVLSRRTVDHHVSAILRTLGVSSRREAAKIAASLGLD
ncbi:AAA family ATPase [Kribbella albertanoniae]